MPSCGGGGGGAAQNSVTFDAYAINYNADGSVATYSYAMADVSGKIRTSYWYDSAGDDALWFTSDDRIVAGTIDEYNDDNNIIKDATLDGSKSVTEFTDYTYDLSGKLIKEVKTDVIFTPRSYTVDYAYNSLGDRLLTTYTAFGGNITGYDVYVYDAQNRLVTRGYQYPDGTFLWYTDIQYDSKGNRLSVVRNAWDASTATYIISDKEVWQYDINNNITTYSYYKYDTATALLSFAYKDVNEYDQNNRIIKTTRYTGNVDATLLFYNNHVVLNYDTNGNLLLKESYDITGLVQTDTYTYDANNNKKTYKYLNVITGNLYQVTYQYDSSNTCINIDSISYDSTGSVLLRKVEAPATGQMLKYTETLSITEYNGPGADGVWFTDDDSRKYQYEARIY